MFLKLMLMLVLRRAYDRRNLLEDWVSVINTNVKDHLEKLKGHLGRVDGALVELLKHTRI